MLAKKLAKYNIILASKSPRRQQFLKDLQIPFRVEIKEVNEIYPPELQGAAITDYLAKLKSTPFSKNLTKNDLLITSDTIVWLNNNALGKPKKRQDAIEMLQALSGNKHQVISSVCITNTAFTKVFNEITNVYFKKLSNTEIEYYVDTYKPFDKAGSYGIQEWIGYIGIEKIEGSYFNVMGLPIFKLYEELMKL